MPIPLLILSDNPGGSTGLGRICRELTARIHEHLGEVFEVATYSPGQASGCLEFKHYAMESEPLTPFLSKNMPSVWKEFAGDRRGIVLSIMNVSHIPWLSDPERFATGELREFMLTKPFERWGYFPIDGDTRPNRLALNMAEAIAGFDRIAHYTHWAQGITNVALSVLGKEKESVVLPHGLDTDVFAPRNRASARDTLFERITGGAHAPIKDDVVLIGVVATNTPRKDWYLAFETCAELVKRGVNVGLVCHTDHPRKSWDLAGLAREFGLTGKTIASTRGLTDEDLAWFYSACDVTLGIGSGEGWGYPLVESMACGVPVVHGNYAGGAELVTPELLVEPIGFRGDGFFSVRRPIFDAKRWADLADFAVGGQVELPDYIKWDNAWEAWKQWILEGINHG